MKATRLVLVGCLAVFCGTFGFVRPALATTYLQYQMQGDSCFYQDGSGGSTPSYSPYGVTNTSSSYTTYVFCPIMLPSQNYTYGYIFIVGYNRNSTYSTSCNLLATTAEGTNYQVATATMSGNSSSYNDASTSLTVANSATYFFLTCQIAPSTSSGQSYVSSIYLEVGY
jgi:hypothetical protein